MAALQKRKETLSGKGGVGEGGGCDSYKWSRLRVNCPFAAEERSSQQEGYTNISSALAIDRLKIWF